MTARVATRALIDDEIELGRGLVREYVRFTHEEAVAQGVTGMPLDLAGLELLMPDIEHFADHYLGGDGRFIVAERTHDVVGGVGVVRHDDGTAVMKRLWVRPEGRGLGAGRALAAAAVAAARELRCRSIALDVAPYRSRAIDLYRSLGFETRAPIDRYPFEMVALQRDLTDE